MDKIVVGDGPEKQRLQQKYPYVSFVGMKKGQDLAKYYANAETLVFPSKTDTFGNVILESLASGTPVAAYPVTGPKDILKNSLIDSLDNDIENSLKKALKIDRNDCRKFAMQFTWDRCANQFLSNIVNAKN
jgi:glycosyltransferase involved in cell wall biosynthesis